MRIPQTQHPNSKMADRLAAMRSKWDKFAVTFTETANKRATLQCAQQLHANMQLEHATAVLEVAAGAGLGSLDIARYLSESAASDSPKSLTVTDFSPVMVGLARENLKATGSSRLRVQCVEANGMFGLLRLSSWQLLTCVAIVQHWTWSRSRTVQWTATFRA